MIWNLMVAFLLGALSFLGFGFYLNYRQEKAIQDEIKEEEQFIVRTLETMLLFGVEYEDITLFVIPTEIKGILALKVAFHEEDEDIIEYAIAQGKEITLINPSEWAYVLGDEGVRAVPCLEDLEDYFDDDSEDDQ